MDNNHIPDYGPRDIEHEYFQEVYRADRLLARAKAGDEDAIFEIGKCFYFGEGRSENYRLALDYFLKIAESGNAEAQFYVGCIYEQGETENKRAFKGVVKNYDEAVKWFSKAAQQGFEKAIQALERLNHQGFDTRLKREKLNREELDLNTGIKP